MSLLEADVDDLLFAKKNRLFLFRQLTSHVDKPDKCRIKRETLIVLNFNNKLIVNSLNFFAQNNLNTLKKHQKDLTANEAMFN